MKSQRELKKIMSRMHPMSLVSDKYLPELIKKSLCVSHVKGDVLIKDQTIQSNLRHYLLSGSVELRLSMDDRSELIYCDQEKWCRKPLQDLLTQSGGRITAQSDCEVLIINSDYVDELLACSQTSALSFVHLESGGDLYSDAVIDDQFEEEWMEIFLQTPLAAHLSPSKLHELFQAIEDREVKEGELIVKESTQGNAFYIIKEGLAQVSSAHAGALKKSVDLFCGDYFGDESLVANTPCNANVTMLENGVLGVLSERAFETLVKPALIKAMSEAQLLDQPNSKDICWVDVRLPQEFKYGHRRQSVNYPVGSLRQILKKLDTNCCYVITPDGGCRSELAAYLMRQSGLNAYLCLAS